MSIDTVGDQRTNETAKLDDSPRIPTLLLLSMFAIAARYGPVAHGTMASPSQSKKRDTSLPSVGPSAPELSGAFSTSSSNADSASTATQDETNEDANTDIEADAALPLPPSGVMWAAGDGFLERAKVILDRTYSSSRPSTCQALLLMGYREIGIGAMAQSWLYVGMAVRMVRKCHPARLGSIIH